METRSSGVLMPLSSLPSKYAIGVMGDETKKFIKNISDMGFSYWQVLPLNPPDFYGSPYASNSAFAISLSYISPDELLKEGLVSQSDVERCVYHGSPYTADYEFAYLSRFELLKIAYGRIDENWNKKIDEFEKENEWCKAYSLYNVLKIKFDNNRWQEWGDEFSRYENAAIHDEDINSKARFYSFIQLIAFNQWKGIKLYANDLGVKILGDMPIYVSSDSVEVWSERKFFDIDEETFENNKSAGVPPDYFSKDGQLWGNPIYNWDEMDKDGYMWWIRRIRAALKMYDVVRIDHFRAFASYWAVEKGSVSAKNGEWVEGPGMKLFNALKDEMGEAHIVAEDLGSFGEDVVKLLKDSGFPGMRVVQFGFDPGSDSTHLPHNYPRNSIAYVGTHDNNTLLGWLWEAGENEKRFALDYCGFKGDNWGDGGFQSPSCRSIIETVWRSSSVLSIISFQDMCGFGSDARMNTPGKAEGNWLFRTTGEMIDMVDSEYYKKINRIFKRKSF